MHEARLILTSFLILDLLNLNLIDQVNDLLSSVQALHKLLEYSLLLLLWLVFLMVLKLKNQKLSVLAVFLKLLLDLLQLLCLLSSNSLTLCFLDLSFMLDERLLVLGQLPLKEHLQLVILLLDRVAFLGALLQVLCHTLVLILCLGDASQVSL